MCNRNEYEYDFYPGRCRDDGGCRNEGIYQFLRTLVPGTCIVIQYDSQRPTRAVFQGFRRRTLLVSDIEGFPRCSGFTHIAVNKINAVSIHSNCRRDWDDCDNE